MTSFLVNIGNWVLTNWILPLFPTNLPFFSYSNFVSILNSLKSFLIFMLSTVGQFVDVPLFLIVILTILTGSIALFGVKGIMWVLNIVRGSGA